MMELFAATGILQVAGTLYFVVFWSWFDFWRRHAAATYAMMFATFVAVGVALVVWRDDVFVGEAPRAWVRAIGWAAIAIACVLGTVADRQIGFRVRSFTPFFEERGRIALKTTGAYAIVRHPIYASGVCYQLGVWMVTGMRAVGVACAIFALGAMWFTRQEERRLVALLDDPSAYDRYRARVPALVPGLAWVARRFRSGRSG